MTSLLQGFQQETEMFVASNLRDDRSVDELLQHADYTFVNERLARQYGIPGVYGTRFRRVALRTAEQRGVFSPRAPCWSPSLSDHCNLARALAANGCSIMSSARPFLPATSVPTLQNKPGTIPEQTRENPPSIAQIILATAAIR